MNNIELIKENEGLRAFKKFFMDMQGQGLSVEGAHLNVENKPLDAIIDFAQQYEEEAAASITEPPEPPFILVNEVGGLNHYRQAVEGRLVYEAQQVDGTFKGALAYLENLTESIIEYDDHFDGDNGHITAWKVRQEARFIIERQFRQEMERHKEKNIWKEGKAE